MWVKGNSRIRQLLAAENVHRVLHSSKRSGLVGKQECSIENLWLSTLGSPLFGENMNLVPEII